MSTAVQELKKDFSSDVNAAIPEAEHLALTSLDDAINHLMNLERQCRLAGDFISLKHVCLSMISMCHKKPDWTKLNSVIAVICKKRSQSKIAITAVVEESMKYLDTTPNDDVKLELIKTLTEVSEGKMYVEAECARLHLLMALMLEKRGQLDEACAMIQDVHVETYGSVSKEEKVNFILEQIRLNLLRKDYIRTLIQSRKMNKKLLEDDALSASRVRFNVLMLEYYLHEKKTWEAAQCWYDIFNTKTTKAHPDTQLVNSLKATIVFLLLSRFNPDQQEMLRTVQALHIFEEPLRVGQGGAVVEEEKKEEESTAAATTAGGATTSGAGESTFAKNVPLLASFFNILKQFTTNEIIPMAFPHSAELIAFLKQLCEESDNKDIFPYAYLSDQGDKYESLVSLLRVRVIQHNIRVIAGYYTTMNLHRMCELCDLSMSELELQLTECNASGDIYLRIDRPAAIITFGRTKPVDSLLSAWNADITELLNIMETTSHLIQRENMIHKVK